MDLSTIISEPWLSWVVVPTLIFLARILDVSIGTLRVIFISKGMRLLAPILGFFEVFIWLLAIGEIMNNLTNWMNYFAYSAGFALGNHIGMEIERRLALGLVILRIITNQKCDDLTEDLRSKDLGVTVVSAEGKFGPTKILFLMLSRKKLQTAQTIIKKHNPHAFYSIEDIRYANEGIFPNRREARKHLDLLHRNWFRKRK